MPPKAKPTSEKTGLRRLFSFFGATEKSLPVGIVGTSNYSGTVQKEENSILRGPSAYGYTSGIQWGEWEKILRTDPDVSSAMEFVKAQIRDCRVTVEEYKQGETATEVSKQQAEFVRWCLLEKCAPGWPEIKNQLAGALVPGFSLHEIIWDTMAHPFLPGGKGYGISALRECLPASVQENGWTEVNGELAEIKQLGQKADGTFGYASLPTEKALLFSWNRSGNNYLGFSAFRAVWYLCKIRAELLKLAGVALSREGAGIPVAQSQNNDATLDADQREKLEQLLANVQFHENSSVVMPVGWKIDWIYSPGANKGHILEAWSQLGKAILRQVFAQQLSLGADSSNGSRAVGEVHDGTADSFVQGVLAGIEGALNGAGNRPYEGLPRKLIDANWGPQPGYPKIKLELKQVKIDVATKATAVQTLVSAGALTLTLDDENSLREALGLASISAEVRDAGKQKPQPAPQQQAFSLSRKFEAKPFTANRPLRFAEERLDLQRQSDFLERAKFDFEKAIRPAVVEMLVSALPEIEEAISDGRPDDVADVPLDSSRISEIVKKFLRVARVEGAAQVRAETEKGSKKVIDSRAAGVAMAAGEEDEKIKEETDEELESEEKLLTRRIKNRLSQELESEALHGKRQGADAGEIIRKVVSRQLDTGAFRGDAGVIITTAWNLGREEAGEMLGTKRVQYSAILDNAVCDPCAALDGQEWDFNSSDHNANLPPNRNCEGGARCRCVLIYLQEGE